MFENPEMDSVRKRFFNRNETQRDIEIPFGMRNLPTNLKIEKLKNLNLLLLLSFYIPFTFVESYFCVLFVSAIDIFNTIYREQR